MCFGVGDFFWCPDLRGWDKLHPSFLSSADSFNLGEVFLAESPFRSGSFAPLLGVGFPALELFKGSTGTEIALLEVLFPRLLVFCVGDVDIRVLRVGSEWRFVFGGERLMFIDVATATLLTLSGFPTLHPC